MRLKTAIRMALTICILSVTGATWGQDGSAVIDQRQDFMKAQGRAHAAVKSFVEGKADITVARAQAEQFAQLSPSKVLDFFPQNTGMIEYPGKSYAKPDIWANWDKFSQAATFAGERAQELHSVLQNGDQAAISSALDGMSKGCGGCHTVFREKKT
jgi:cytochrome c556